MNNLQKLDAILRHISNVRENCELLGKKLIEAGQEEFGRLLIANGLIHDVSKLKGAEWEFMCSDTANRPALKNAILQHEKTNMHHPEYWPGGLQDMPDIYIAEFCCDVKARSEEFGTDLRNWIDTHALKRWKITKKDRVYSKIMEYVDLLCDKPFESLDLTTEAVNYAVVPSTEPQPQNQNETLQVPV